MKRKLFILLAIVFLFTNVTAQEEESGTLPIKPWQATFLFPPLSNDFGNTSKNVYNLSINLFYGNTGGVHGFEFSSFINQNRTYMRGLQIAGFGNLVGGEANGFQFAGFLNMADEGKLYTQFAGFTNSSGDIEGFQFAGFLNSARNIEGFQFGGFMNIAQDVDGVQFAGFMNVAKYVKGVQFGGFLNVCDYIDGVPIGFINIVGNDGYSNFEVSVADKGNIFIAGKLGIKKLYNIYSIGKLNGPGNRFAYGFGVGTEREISESLLANFEVTAYQEFWVGEKKEGNKYASFITSSRLNMWNQIKLNLGWQLEGMQFFLGPTFNISVAGISEDNWLVDDIAPNWTFGEDISKRGREVKYWFGFNAGIRFKKKPSAEDQPY